MRFIVADDSQIARGMLEGAIVNDCGHEVVGEALNGQQAIALCRELRPDVVILDVNMPPLNGDEAAETIRSEGVAGKIIIASLARHCLPGFKARGFGTLAKPYKREQLAREIREVLDEPAG
ncbi:MAG: response regulator transcription factor [Patescibacteria group bacterium]|nr:response regulator transcription factor [Patescibacteria group bacterium]